MNRSLNTSGRDQRRLQGGACAVSPAASKSALGRALTSGRRLRATQPVSPWPLRTVIVREHVGFDAGGEPAAQVSVSSS